MNNPFDYIPTRGCTEAFDRLKKYVSALSKGSDEAHRNFCRELEGGKMLGVLIAEDSDGARHSLYAFSGQIGEYGFYFPGFVGPVFDYLQPDGHFRTEEHKISLLNKEIDRYMAEVVTPAHTACEDTRERMESVMAEAREQYKLAKAERQKLRDSGALSSEQLEQLTRQSQFEKAELSRLKKRVRAQLEPYESAASATRRHLEALKERRRADSEKLQQWLFDHFMVSNAEGESRSLSEIFAATPLAVPPSGAGECCAPKLLQYAYLQGWKPLEIAEFWYGHPKDGEVRIHGEHYPACRGKCLPVLSWMLKGLDVNPPLDSLRASAFHSEPEILFETDSFCIVSKPSGMLSVPGKGHSISLQHWLQAHYGPDRDVKMAHRLDQDTSGLMIATFDAAAYSQMQALFARRCIKKKYIALLDGDFRRRSIPETGTIDLPLSPDLLDRPRQRVDHADGKEAVTRYRFLDVTDGKSRVEFQPLTGRTHQLRVHAASAEGLGMPISGDPLYGTRGGSPRPRLHLHAASLDFTFGPDNRTYHFESPAPF